MSFGEAESSMSLPSREDSSTSSQSQCSTNLGLIAGTWHRPLFLTRDRWFESGSLLRRVINEPQGKVTAEAVAIANLDIRLRVLSPLCNRDNYGRNGIEIPFRSALLYT